MFRCFLVNLLGEKGVWLWQFPYKLLPKLSSYFLTLASMLDIDRAPATAAGVMVVRHGGGGGGGGWEEMSVFLKRSRNILDTERLLEQVFWPQLSLYVHFFLEQGDRWRCSKWKPASTGPTGPCLKLGQRTEKTQLETTCQLDQHHVV